MPGLLGGGEVARQLRFAFDGPQPAAQQSEFIPQAFFPLLGGFLKLTALTITGRRTCHFDFVSLRYCGISDD